MINAIKDLHESLGKTVGFSMADRIIQHISDNYLIASIKDVRKNNDPRGIEEILFQNSRLLKRNAMIQSQIEENLVEIKRAQNVIRKYKDTLEGKINDQN
jgi:flagellin-specific chaperone FliS